LFTDKRFISGWSSVFLRHVYVRLACLIPPRLMSNNWHLSLLSPMTQGYWEKLILLHLPAVPLISLADFFAHTNA
jgi:hypothetical protein